MLFFHLSFSFPAIIMRSPSGFCHHTDGGRKRERAGQGLILEESIRPGPVECGFASSTRTVSSLPFSSIAWIEGNRGEGPLNGQQVG